MGTAEARVRLIEEYPYILRVVRRVAQRFPRHLRSEAESAALPLMVEAAYSYDESAPFTFRQHVCFRVVHGMEDAVREYTGFHRASGTPREDPTLDKALHDGDSDETSKDMLASRELDPHEWALAKERIERLGALPPRWIQAMTLDVGEAAVTLGVSRSRISQIRRAVRRVLEDGRPIRIALAQPSPPRRQPGQNLTEREIEVLRLVAAGDTNGQVAAKLELSEETIKSHVRHVIARLGARNRVHAVNLAWEAGWWAEEPGE